MQGTGSNEIHMHNNYYSYLLSIISFELYSRYDFFFFIAILNNVISQVFEAYKQMPIVLKKSLRIILLVALLIDIF